MNRFADRLYDDLMALVKVNEAFYFVDRVLDGVTYRIFNYRLAQYSDFKMNNGAGLECRGVMFEVDGDSPIRLASLTLRKFFNLGENPFTMDLDLKSADQISLKMDGSLMSTYLHKGELRLKSKGSLESEHCINAMKWLNLPENGKFKEELFKMAHMGYTVNLEYTSNEDGMRIVVGYDKPALTVLAIRDIVCGSYLPMHYIAAFGCAEILNHWTDIVETDDSEAFINSINDMTGIEGYVVKLSDGTMFKVKTAWYRALHFTKDSVNSPRRLFEAVLDETTDDLRAMFSDDPSALGLILDMETKVDRIYNHLVASVENFYSANKTLDVKDFAIKAQAELDKKAFSLVMAMYRGKEINFKESMKKWYKDYGIKDSMGDEE